MLNSENRLLFENFSENKYSFFFVLFFEKIALSIYSIFNKDKNEKKKTDEDHVR